MFQVQSAVYQVTFISAFSIIGDASYIVGAVFVSLIYHAGIFVWISTLVYIFIIHGEIKLSVLCRQIDSAYSSAEFISVIYVFVIECILEESSFISVEESGRKGEFGADTVIVSKRCVVLVVRSGTKAYVGSLIVERRFGEYTYQASHRIASVQSSLRTSQHVYAFYVGVIEIESSLFYERDVVYIKSYSRSVYTRAYTSYIYRCGKLRAIIWDKQVWHQSGYRFH